MDIKAQIESIADKIRKDKSLQAEFKKDPVKAVEKMLGVDLPDEVIEKVVTGVKARVALGDWPGAMGALRELF